MNYKIKLTMHDIGKAIGIRISQPTLENVSHGDKYTLEEYKAMNGQKSTRIVIKDGFSKNEGLSEFLKQYLLEGRNLQKETKQKINDYKKKLDKGIIEDERGLAKVVLKEENNELHLAYLADNKSYFLEILSDNIDLFKDISKIISNNEELFQSIFKVIQQKKGI